MMVAVLQLSVVRSILFFVTLVLWTDEQYDYGDVSHSFTVQYVLILLGEGALCSVILSMKIQYPMGHL